MKAVLSEGDTIGFTYNEATLTATVGTLGTSGDADADLLVGIQAGIDAALTDTSEGAAAGQAGDVVASLDGTDLVLTAAGDIAADTLTGGEFTNDVDNTTVANDIAAEEEAFWSAVIELSGTGTGETDFQEDQSYNFTLTLTEQGEGSTLETFTLLDTFQVGVASLGNNIADQLAQQINQAFVNEFTATTDDGNLVIEAVDPETNYDISTIFVEIA